MFASRSQAVVVILETIELRRVELELTEPVRTSTGTHAARPVLMVRVMGPESEGFGECAALLEPTYTEEYLDGAEQVLSEHLIPRLLAKARLPARCLSPCEPVGAHHGASDDETGTSHPADISAAALSGILRDVKGHAMARAALEMAILDADLSREGTSLAELLGGTRTHVDAGVTVGIAASPEALVDRVRLHVERGYRKVKVKIAPGWDVRPLSAVREAFPDLALSADANGSFTSMDIGALCRLDPLGLLVLEQPFDRWDLVSHAALAKAMTTPIGLDESIPTLDALETAHELGACDAVCVKPHRVGGYLAAKQIHDACTSAGISIWCGGMFETSFARAAALALASLPGFNMPSDLAASDRYFTTDIAAPHTLQDGTMAVPTSRGVGRQVDLETVRRLTSRIRCFS